MASSELEQLMTPFEPDPDSFYHAACRIPTDADLDRIAGADFGDPDPSLAALRRICSGEAVPVKTLELVSRDCSVIRWSAPNTYNPDHGRLSPDVAAWHRRRLLSCAVLLRLHVLDYCDRGIGDAAAIAIADCLRFQPDLLPALRRLIAAIAISKYTYEEEIPSTVMACIVCALAEEHLQPPATSLAAAAEAACDGLRRVTDKVNEGAKNPVDLYYYGIRFDLWRSLVHHFLVEPQRPHPPEADAALRRLGRMILDGAKS